MILRKISKKVKEALNNQPAVVLLGPRQVGKTTLALSIAAEQNAVYLDLESYSDRSKLADPILFFENMADRLVILDEIHRMPELLQTLRGVIDKGRQRGLDKGRFLILGSASIDLLKQSSETLAGRVSHIEMTPVTATEIKSNLISQQKLWSSGGFPNSYLATTDETSFIWRKDFVKTYLERDIPMFGPRIPSQTIERLWIMLAHNHGCLLNSSELARSLAISTQSVNRYVDLLVDLLLVRRLQPYHANVNKRLVKSPKVYLRDTGLLHSLLGIEDLNELMGHPVIGRSWESFVIENILSELPWRSTPFFYRTRAGAEVDLLIESKQGKLCLVEIKRGLEIKVSKGFHQAIEDLKPEKAFIVYGGEQRYPLSEKIEALSCLELIKELAS
ncbi:MAG: ATP-binding protein [Candidatus Caenarcaniphilales bacterium]|nr:ATP-binding protein [Candidatus Caenarcaniphilales bacterium]